eukprot:scaffold581839_cov51-Prasinocladus_malaysianus.AAC.1
MGVNTRQRFGVSILLWLLLSASSAPLSASNDANVFRVELQSAGAELDLSGRSLLQDTDGGTNPPVLFPDGSCPAISLDACVVESTDYA